MQTYIFLFTPRIRLDCTNEIKNWISCEEKKRKPVRVRAVARINPRTAAAPGTPRLRARRGKKAGVAQDVAASGLPESHRFTRKRSSPNCSEAEQAPLPRPSLGLTLLTTFCCCACFCLKLATSLHSASFSLQEKKRPAENKRGLAGRANKARGESETCSRGFAAASRRGLVYSLTGPRVKCCSLTLLRRDSSPGAASHTWAGTRGRARSCWEPLAGPCGKGWGAAPRPDVAQGCGVGTIRIQLLQRCEGEAAEAPASTGLPSGAAPLRYPPAIPSSKRFFELSRQVNENSKGWLCVCCEHKK